VLVPLIDTGQLMRARWEHARQTLDREVRPVYKALRRRQRRLQGK
jgi:hypothetical protein